MLIPTIHRNVVERWIVRNTFIGHTSVKYNVNVRSARNQFTALLFVCQVVRFLVNFVREGLLLRFIRVKGLVISDVRLKR